LWNRAVLDANRIAIAPELARIVVAIDPAVTNHHEGSDETGIVVAGVAKDRQIYSLADVSLKGSTETWAKRAVDAYHLHEADRIIAEVNNGGDLAPCACVSDPGSAVHAAQRTRQSPIPIFDV
jgi:phage terminase large subunit-like protein